MARERPPRVGRSLWRPGGTRLRRGQAWVSARHAVEAVAPLDEQYCEVTVLWCHSIDGGSRIHARYRPLLRRVPAPRAGGAALGDARINTVTLIDGPRVAAPTEG